VAIIDELRPQGPQGLVRESRRRVGHHHCRCALLRTRGIADRRSRSSRTSRTVHHPL